MRGCTPSPRIRPVSRRSGMTLMEVLIVISIIALLISIILPAIHAARSTSRRYQCASHQRQLMLAVSNYHDTYSVFPPLAPMSYGDCTPPTPINRLFPYLELPPICDLMQSNVKRLPVLECPADADVGLMGMPLSYAVNVSPGIGSGSPYAGPFDLGQVVGARDISDGLSATAGISENIVVRARGTPADAERNPVRYYWGVYVPPSSPSATMAEIAAETDQSIEDCELGPRTFQSLPHLSGGSWGTGVFGGAVAWTYSHWFSPNAPLCGASNLSMGRQPFLLDNRRAASGHSGGVNVVYLDGHQRFISNNVDRSVWRAAGTRNGNDSVGE